MTRKAAKKIKTSDTSVSALKGQYEIIRKDIVKLREDLTKGYSMAKGFVEKKGIVSQLTNAKK